MVVFITVYVVSGTVADGKTGRMKMVKFWGMKRRTDFNWSAKFEFWSDGRMRK